MKSVSLNGPGSLSLVDVNEPEPGRGEVVVEVAACGICGSDLHSFKGEHPLVIYPVTPGHEFSGTVVAIGEGVEDGLVGMAVCVEPSLFCGRCPQCLSGRYNICSELKVLGFQAPGAMCQFIAVPAHRVHPLPQGVELLAAALAEPLAVGVHALERSRVSGGDTVLIVGAGVIGLMVLKASKAHGCRVVVVESSEERAARALRLGADEALTFAEVESGDALFPGPDSGFGAVFECVGRAGTVDLAVRSAPRGGTVVIVGVPPGPVPVPMALVQDGELELRGTLMYRCDDFGRALDLLGNGTVRAEDFITHRVSLDDIESGYAILEKGGPRTLKVMVDVKGGDLVDA